MIPKNNHDGPAVQESAERTIISRLESMRLESKVIDDRAILDLADTCIESVRELDPQAIMRIAAYCKRIAHERCNVAFYDLSEEIRLTCTAMRKLMNMNGTYDKLD